MAAQAVTGGKVHVGDARVKPARKIRPGEQLQIRRSDTLWEVVVRGLSERRLPAKEAVLLYEEAPQSIARRELEAKRRKAQANERAQRLGKPSKRDRRELVRLKGRATPEDLT